MRFEVASVKISTAQPDSARMAGGPGTTTPGQFTATGVTLKNLLFNRAYVLAAYQYAAPSWMDTARYDVAAKVPRELRPTSSR
jgi:uncharacterized protein (TIGR03435 family)